MLIVAIAWIYVVLMMALTETSFTAGLATFIFYGILPLSVVLYLLGTPARRRRARAENGREIPSRKWGEIPENRPENTDLPGDDSAERH